MMTATSVGRSGLLDREWAFWAMVVTATVVGAGLRLHGLGKPSFWVDEFFTIARAGGDPLHWINAFGYLPSRLSLWLSGADLSRIHLDAIEAWPSLGVSERAARLGPCWVGILTVPILAWLARPIAGGGVAGASALILSLTPWHVYWSQMARFYTTQFLFANVFLLLFVRAMQTGRKLTFVLATLACVLAFTAHFTSLVMVGVCLALLVFGWIARIPTPNRAAGVATLVSVGALSLLLLVLRELDTRVPGSLATFSGESWDPSPLTLLLGSVLRIEPVTFIVAMAWVPVALRRRESFGLLVSAAAILVPAAMLSLQVIFPVGPRYYFSSLFAWTSLAALWAVEVDRRLSASAGRIAGASGLAALLVATSFSAYLYTRDGAGGRARWREAFAFVTAHAEPADAVVTATGGFQARYYLGRKTAPLASVDVAALAPGTWVIQRTRGAQPPADIGGLESKARFEIPSKPWSWVLHVNRVPLR